MDCKILSFTLLKLNDQKWLCLSIVICNHTNAKTHAPDTGIVLYSKLFHISCITVIYSRYIINLISPFIGILAMPIIWRIVQLKIQLLSTCITIMPLWVINI
jgi:hypothetical protein